MKKHPKKYCPDGPISTKTKMYKIHLSFIVLGIYNFDSYVCRYQMSTLLKTTSSSDETKLKTSKSTVSLASKNLIWHGTELSNRQMGLYFFSTTPWLTLLFVLGKTVLTKLRVNQVRSDITSYFHLFT